MMYSVIKMPASANATNATPEDVMNMCGSTGRLIVVTSDLELRRAQPLT